MVNLQLLDMNECDSAFASLDPWESKSKLIFSKPHLCAFITISLYFSLPSEISYFLIAKSLPN